MSDIAPYSTPDFIAPSAFKAKDAQVTQLVRDRGIAQTVFWRPKVEAGAHRIASKVIEVTRSWIEGKENPEAIADRIEAALDRESSPRRTVRPPMRSIDEVISAQNQDQGRLDDTDHTTQHPNVLTQTAREIGMMDPNPLREPQPHTDAPIQPLSETAKKRGPKPKQALTARERNEKLGFAPHAPSPQSLREKNRVRPKAERPQPAVAPASKDIQFLGGGAIVYPPSQPRLSPMPPLPVNTTSARTIDDAIHDMMSVEREYERRKAELRDEVILLATTAVVAGAAEAPTIEALAKKKHASEANRKTGATNGRAQTGHL